jgi:hypothetical protein
VEQPALAEQQQAITAGRLVHDVAGDDQRGARPCQGVEAVPELDPQHRVQPHGRLVEHQQLGGADQRAGERGPALLPAGEVPHQLPGGLAQPHVGQGGVGLARRAAVQRGEVPHVLAHRQVEVHARRLGDVADPGAQAHRPGRLAEDGDRSRLHPLHADDGPHQGRLPAAARPQQPGDLAGRDGERQPVEDGPAPADDDQVGDGDGVGHGGLLRRNSTPDELNAR